jgi:hypothetical protein
VGINGSTGTFGAMVRGPENDAAGARKNRAGTASDLSPRPSRTSRDLAELREAPSARGSVRAGPMREHAEHVGTLPRPPRAGMGRESSQVPAGARSNTGGGEHLEMGNGAGTIACTFTMGESVWVPRGTKASMAWPSRLSQAAATQETDAWPAGEPMPLAVPRRRPDIAGHAEPVPNNSGDWSVSPMRGDRGQSDGHRGTIGACA